ncbi:WDR82 [Enterospora canceri]|uniref:WDR82 n=1 Tax=Enterospora canceri TaxID=1081671 RepID=A0A1Y1S5V9_9MICR|nr:WDR82 [Enterospora canceri]
MGNYNILEKEYTPNMALLATEEKEKRYFEMSKEVSRTSEAAKIKQIEYNYDGNLLTYSTRDTLKIFPALTSGEIFRPKNIISINMDQYAFVQSHTLVHTAKEKMFYLSIHDNKYLRDFVGNDSPIQDISIDSINDTIMSVTRESIDLWDIRMANPTKKILNPMPLGALSNGHFYCMADNNFIAIFDKRNDQKYLTKKAIQSNFYKKVAYVPDGTKILLKTATSYYFYSNMGELNTYITLENPNDGAVTPDSANLLCPSRNYVFSYKIEDRKKLDSLDTGTENNRIRVSPAGNQFVVGNENRIQVYNF